MRKDQVFLLERYFYFLEQEKQHGLLVGQLKSQPRFLLTIEGHSDERGTNEYNLALGERRANSVKDYLVSLGIAADRLRTISYGEERPVCTESEESCWQQNRRAHHVVTGRQE